MKCSLLFLAIRKGQQLVDKFNGGAHGSASVYGVSADAGARLGTEDNNIAIEAEGSAFKAEVVGDAGIFTGEGSQFGPLLDANAGAFVAEGEFTFGYSVFGIQAEGVFGGSFASAHAGLAVGATYDSESGNLTIQGIEHFGFGVGEKAGMKITIPLDWLINSNDDK